MELKLNDEGKLEIKAELDITENIKNSLERQGGGFDYYFKDELKQAVVQRFMEKYGDEVVEQLKDKLLTEWVEVFKSEVLSKALAEVMNKNRGY